MLRQDGPLDVNIAEVSGGAVVIPISGTVTANQGTPGAGAWPIKGSGTAGAADAGVVSVQGIASMTPVLVSGTQANNAAITANPQLLGFEAQQSQGTTNATAGRIVQAIADRNGRTITISPKITQASSNGSAITTATTTDVVAAPSAGSHLKIYRIHASNSGATATWVYWVDSNGTTKLYPSYLPTNGIVSLDLNGRWELTSNKKLQINTSAGGNVEWHVDYETVAD